MNELKIIAVLLAKLLWQQGYTQGDKFKTPEDIYDDAVRIVSEKDGTDAGLEALAVEEIYKAYPTTDAKAGGRNLGKCAKNKAQIRTLLKTHTKEYILYQISRYIQDCNATDTYMKNFGTFLNNLPEYTEDMPVASPRRSHKPNTTDEYATVFNR